MFSRLKMLSLCKRGFLTVTRSPVYSSMSTFASKQYKIVQTSDGSTVVAWHPQSDFPYECTRPLPKANETVDESVVLKTQLTPEVMGVFNKKTEQQAIAELSSLTNTTFHRWYPRARNKKAKKTPMEREYL